MQRVTKKTKVEDDLTPEEVADVKEFYNAKEKGQTKKSSLEELLKELHE